MNIISHYRFGGWNAECDLRIMILKHAFITKLEIFRTSDYIMSGKIARIGLVASMLSVVLSLYIYFVGDDPDRMLGIFVGLWAPTLILATKELEALLEDSSS